MLRLVLVTIAGVPFRVLLALLLLCTFLAIAPAAWAAPESEQGNVPEPASLAVLGAASGALLIARARRK